MKRAYYSAYLGRRRPLISLGERASMSHPYKDLYSSARALARIKFLVTLSRIGVTRLSGPVIHWSLKNSGEG